MTALYLDVHVPSFIAAELRRPGVDVITAREDQTAELTDDALLERAGQLGRVIFTQNIRFKALAESWQRGAVASPGYCSGTSSTALSANTSAISIPLRKPPTRLTGSTKSSNCHSAIRPCQRSCGRCRNLVFL